MALYTNNTKERKIHYGLETVWWINQSVFWGRNRFEIRIFWKQNWKT
jgi:hypothetical protein